MKFLNKHPILLLLVALVASPFIGAMIAVAMILGSVIEMIFKMLFWPFRFLTGLVFGVLGGGIR